MYTRSYGSRPSITSRPLHPEYGGTALVIPQPEAEPTPPPRPEPPILSPQPASRPPQPSTEAPSTPNNQSPHSSSTPQAARPQRPSRPRFSGRRNRPITAPSMPTVPDYDPRRPEDTAPSPADRRDPLGAPPFGGLGIPPLRGLEKLFGTADTSEHIDREPPEGTPPKEEDSATSPSHPLLPFTTLALRQDDLLLLGLLLFLLHEQDEGDTDCRDALLLLAVLFVAGL